MGRLAGKTAIVTGGASGIGLAIVQRFIAEGAAVEVLEREMCVVEGAVVSVCDVADESNIAMIALIGLDHFDAIVR